MTGRRVLSVVFMLLVAIMACGPAGGTLPVTDTPAPRPTNTARAPRPTTRAPTQVVATKESPTQEQPTSDSPTQEPQPTNVPATRVPRATATPPHSAGCAAFNPSNVAWVTLDASGNVDQQVDTYPDGATDITAFIQYDCVPKPLTLVWNWSNNGQQVATSKTTLNATNAKSGLTSSLGNGGNPLPNGDFTIEYYVNKVLVAQGAVTVGGGGNSNGNGSGTGNTITVQGTVTDKTSGQPIKGAAVVVLNPGITYKQAAADKFKAADIFTSATTDAQGQYTLPQPLQRNQVYSVAAGAKGYVNAFSDTFKLDDAAADPYQLDVQLSQ